MRIFILADKDQQEELLSKKIENLNELFFNSTFPSDEINQWDAFFILNDSWHSIDFKEISSKPVFINSVTETLSELNLPENVNRMNAWPGFLQRGSWEIASKDKSQCEDIFNHLGRKAIFVKDEPGLVAARVMSMIINEAFFALGEEVSTREEIDLAMKLGTNYPAGPFEWLEKIGVKNIYHLLQKLSEKDTRYNPAPALEKKYKEKESD